MASELDPQPIRRTRRSKGQQESNEFAKVAIVAMVGTCVGTVFQAVSYRLGEHWKLTDFETAQLSIDLDKALSTLPGEAYVKIIENLAKIAPWVGLVVTANSIIAPRVKTTSAIKTANRNAAPVKVDAPKPAEQQQTDLGGDWRTNPAFSIGITDRQIH